MQVCFQIVQVDYNLGGDGYVEQFRKDNLGDVECSCCNLLKDAKDTKSTILVGQKSLADLDADIINMQVCMPGALAVHCCSALV